MIKFQAIVTTFHKVCKNMRDINVRWKFALPVSWASYVKCVNHIRQWRESNYMLYILLVIHSCNSVLVTVWLSYFQNKILNLETSWILNSILLEYTELWVKSFQSLQAKHNFAREISNFPIAPQALRTLLDDIRILKWNRMSNIYKQRYAIYTSLHQPLGRNQKIFLFAKIRVTKKKSIRQAGNQFFFLISWLYIQTKFSKEQKK